VEFRLATLAKVDFSLDVTAAEGSLTALAGIARGSPANVVE
jgi:hypothetical protein